MSLSKIALAAFSFAVIASSGQGSPPIYGSWKGRFQFDLAKIPGATDPKRRAKLFQERSLYKKTAILLTLQPDHTFAMKVTGSPVATRNSSSNGKWTLNGNQLTLLAESKTGRPVPFTVSRDGKTLTFEIMNGAASMTFTR